MKTQGLLQPIVLRPASTGYYLVAGHHRLDAARKLKWEAIPARILEGVDAVEAELCEIDENLIRADLTPAEQAAHHARRKELYEQKYPQSKHGGDRKSAGRKSNPQNADLKSYTENAAEKTGKSRDTVERAVKRGNDIPNVAELAGTSLDQGIELDALVKLREIAPERQAKLIEKAKDGENVRAKAEVRKVQRAVREAELGAKQAALPEKKYGVIYADPPWRFEPYSRDTGMDRAADNTTPR
jgi:ParB-like chromosome segregation protein Spo0J